MKKILILGKSSYIGEKMFSWLKRWPNQYHTKIISTMNLDWQKEDFSQFDTVVNFAGIAHINNITPDMKDLFYSVNRDLAISMCRWSKENGVHHFIQFSSMNVYGDYCENVCDRDAVGPTSFYGDSKLQGDIGIFAMASDDFTVSSVRPPFVYGKGCRGNYNKISKIAKITPVFPDFKNKKSMIFIDNLCEFIRLLIDEGRGGVFTPQNKELVSTADLVREIAKCANRRIWFTKLFNWGIPIGNKLTRTIRRAFADDCYSMYLSDYYDFRYCVVDFKESIKITESNR